MTIEQRHRATTDQCPWWCTSGPAHDGPCRSEGHRIEHRLEAPIEMDDWSSGFDFTEVGVGVDHEAHVRYVWDTHSDGREIMHTPAEARARAALLVEMASLAES